MSRTLALLLVALLLCGLPLLLGIESILLLSLPGGLPLGTLMAALALICGALIASAEPSGLRVLRIGGWIALLFTLPWLPMGIYLSGNPRLSFNTESTGSEVFWLYTGWVTLLVFLLVNATLSVLIWRRWMLARQGGE
jgi:hypothetical protein